MLNNLSTTVALAAALVVVALIGADVFLIVNGYSTEAGGLPIMLAAVIPLLVGQHATANRVQAADKKLDVILNGGGPIVAAGVEHRDAIDKAANVPPGTTAAVQLAAAQVLPSDTPAPELPVDAVAAAQADVTAAVAKLANAVEARAATSRP